MARNTVVDAPTSMTKVELSDQPAPSWNPVNVDLVLVGGGLANSLIAYRLRERHPDLHLLMLEQDSRLGRAHTWSFHHADLTAEQHAWLKPLIAHRWSGYSVMFPRLRRRLKGAYYSISGNRLHEVVQEALGEQLRLNTTIAALSPDQVHLQDGTTITAKAVVDGRGYRPNPDLALAFQKFVGRVVTLTEPHGLQAPIVMDATVPQLDGYRFVYLLPFSERSLLVEDTRYSDSPTLDVGELSDTIDKYLDMRGWMVAHDEEMETGVLPIALSGDIHAFWGNTGRHVPRTGLRAALFHPTTGYSLPHAVRLADDLSALSEFESQALFERIRAHSIAQWQRGRFFRLLNRMLFQAAAPEVRYRVLERFYGLPEPLIERFYAGRLTPMDKARIVMGKPPVPLHRALRCVSGDRVVHGHGSNPSLNKESA
jgi:lycopene beta-cyclase